MKRGSGVFNSQFVPNKQYNFVYNDSSRKLSMPAVSSGSFLKFIYAFMKILVPNGLPYIFLLRKNIKNINSFVGIRHIWVCSILITLSGDIDKNPGPKPSSCKKFSICHCNLNSILAHNFIKISLLRAYISTHKFDILCLSETYVDSRISAVTYPKLLREYLFQQGILGQELKRT